MQTILKAPAGRFKFGRMPLHFQGAATVLHTVVEMRLFGEELGTVVFLARVFGGGDGERWTWIGLLTRIWVADVDNLHKR